MNRNTVKTEPPAAVHTYEMIASLLENNFPIVNFDPDPSEEEDDDDGDDETTVNYSKKDLEMVTLFKEGKQFYKFSLQKNELREKKQFWESSIYFGTYRLLSVEEVTNVTTDVLIDEQMAIKAIISEEKNNFATIHFQFEDQKVPVELFIDICSVKHLQYSLPTSYFIFFNFFVKE